MTVTDDLLQNNARYADAFDKGMATTVDCLRSEA